MLRFVRDLQPETFALDRNGPGKSRLFVVVSFEPPTEERWLGTVVLKLWLEDLTRWAFSGNRARQIRVT